MRYQAKNKHSRRLYSIATKLIHDAVERDARRWNCSKSWIQITALGAFYNIDVMSPYSEKVKHIKTRRKRA